MNIECRFEITIFLTKQTYAKINKQDFKLIN